MGVAWHEGGDARELMVQADTHCGCGAGVIAISSLALPLLEVDQALWEQALLGLEGPPMPPCPACGAALAAQSLALIDVPEESELPALALVRTMDDGHLTWMVADRPEGTDPVLLAEAAPLAAPVDEAQIVTEWGRALSVRSWVRTCVGEAVAHPDGVQTARISPELVMTLVRPSPLDDEAPDEELMAVAGDLARGTIDALLDAGEDADGELLPIPLSGGLRTQMATWLAPWSEEFAESAGMVGLLGLRVVQVSDGVDAIAARHGATPCADPRSPERREKEREARPHADEEAAEELLRWLEVAGIAFGLHIPDVVLRGIGDGITPADALARAIGDMVAVCTRAAGIVEQMRDRDDDTELEVVDINQVIIRAGENRVEMNLESILRKSATDADVMDQVRGAVRYLGSDGGAPMGMMCGCTDTWTIRHLRSPDFAGDYEKNAVTLREVQNVADDQKRPFVALAGVECDHQVAFLMEGNTSFDIEDIDTQIARDRRRVQLPAHAHVLRDVGGEAVGVLVRGPNVATTLINAHLAAALLDALGRRVALGREPLAVAPTTDLMILLRSEVAEDAARAQTLIEATMANSQRLLDPHMRHGSSLGYVGRMERGRQAAGKVTVSWSEEAVLF